MRKVFQVSSISHMNAAPGANLSVLPGFFFSFLGERGLLAQITPPISPCPCWESSVHGCWSKGA